MRIQNLQHFCFIPLFLILYAFSLTAFPISFDLNKLDVISIATFENYSVSKVLSFFQLYILGGIVVTASLTILFSRIYKKSYTFREISMALNPLSLAGILLLFFFHTKTATFQEVDFIVFIGISYIIYFILLRNTVTHGQNISLFLWVSALTFAFIFFIREIGLIFNIFFAFNILWLICFIVICTTFKIFEKKKYFSLNRFLYICRPLFFIPILSVLKSEIYLIFNQRGIVLLTPEKLYFLFTIIIIAFIILFYFRRKEIKRLSKEAYYYVFPVLLSEICMFAYYTPFLEQPDDLFELANPCIAIYKTIHMGAIPFVDYLNSHGLSETFFGFFYILLNGYSGTVDFLLYKFIFYLIYYLICYFFFLRIFGKKPIVLFLILFFPYLFILIREPFVFVLILIYLFYLLFKKYSLFRLLAVCIFSLFCMLWRFDLGLPCILISFILLLYYLTRNYSKQLLFDYLKITALIAGSIVLLCILFYLRTPEQFISNFLQAKDYLICDQAHAYPNILSSDAKANFFHYILFPILSGIMLLFLIYMKSTDKIQKKDNFIWLASIIFILFYFFNFQRGLVRHSLYESSDSFVTALFYLATGLFLLIIFSHKNNYIKNIIFLVTIILSIYIARYPGFDNVKDLFSQFSNAYQSKESIVKLQPYASRIYEQNEFAAEHYNDLKSFMDNNLDDNATFIDFSNTPMMYFYLQREVPSYFCQYMQNTVTEYLQLENLKLLKIKNIPIVLFSNYPLTWFDYTDGVPNTMRYMHICKYIYENYVPHAIINKHAVWLKKGYALKKNDKEADIDFAYEKQNYNLRKYPYLLGKYSNLVPDSRGFFACQSGEKISIPEGIDTKNTYVCIRIQNTHNSGEAIFTYFEDDIAQGEYVFELMPEKREQLYIIPLSNQYNWYIGRANTASISLNPNEANGGQYSINILFLHK